MNRHSGNRSFSALGLLVPVLAVALLLGACAPEGDTDSSEPESGTGTEETTGSGESTSPAGGTTLDGASLVQERCTTCHGIERVEAQDGDRAKWTEIVDSMIARGAQLDAAERETVIGYLAAQYPDK